MGRQARPPAPRPCAYATLRWRRTARPKGAGAGERARAGAIGAGQRRIVARDRSLATRATVAGALAIFRTEYVCVLAWVCCVCVCYSLFACHAFSRLFFHGCVPCRVYPVFSIASVVHSLMGSFLVTVSHSLPSFAELPFLRTTAAFSSSGFAGNPQLAWTALVGGGPSRAKIDGPTPAGQPSTRLWLA